MRASCAEEVDMEWRRYISLVLTLQYSAVSAGFCLGHIENSHSILDWELRSPGEKKDTFHLQSGKDRRRALR